MHAFAKRFTREDALLLAQVDAAHGTLSGSATAHLLRRAFVCYGEGKGINQVMPLLFHGYEV